VPVGRVASWFGGPFARSGRSLSDEDGGGLSGPRLALMGEGLGGTGRCPGPGSVVPGHRRLRAAWGDTCRAGAAPAGALLEVVKLEDVAARHRHR
jgi:hypothetical protein